MFFCLFRENFFPFQRLRDFKQFENLQILKNEKRKLISNSENHMQFYFQIKLTQYIRFEAVFWKYFQKYGQILLYSSETFFSGIFIFCLPVNKFSHIFFFEFFPFRWRISQNEKKKRCY